MNVKIKNEKIVKNIAKKVGASPAEAVNEAIEALEFLPPGFEKSVKKSSLKSTIIETFHNSRLADAVLNDISNVLGKYDYYGVDDFEFDLDKRSFWFYIPMLATEKKLDMDAIHIWLEPGGAQMMVERTLHGIILDDENLKRARVDAADLDLYEVLDAEVVEWEFDLFSDQFDKPGESFTTLNLTILSEEFSSLPPLVKLDKVLNRFEKIVKALKGK